MSALADILTEKFTAGLVEDAKLLIVEHAKLRGKLSGMLTLLQQALGEGRDVPEVLMVELERIVFGRKLNTVRRKRALAAAPETEGSR